MAKRTRKNRSAAFLSWFVKDAHLPFELVALRLEAKYSVTRLVVNPPDQPLSGPKTPGRTRLLTEEFRRREVTLFDATEADFKGAFGEAITCDVVVVILSAVHLEVFRGAYQELVEAGCAVFILAVDPVDENPNFDRAEKEMYQLVDLVVSKLELLLSQ